VGDLGPEITDYLLLSTFQKRYSSCRTAKVVTDSCSGLSRGYGFVRFGLESEQQRSMVEMQGQLCGARPMRISVAIPRNKFSSPPSPSISYVSSKGPLFNDPHNTTVFVGGLVLPTTEHDLFM
jgi:RNA recognition motif-containing protein